MTVRFRQGDVEVKVRLARTGTWQLELAQDGDMNVGVRKDEDVTVRWTWM